MHSLEEKLEAILERNRRVEMNKAWEISPTRRGFIACITYIIATIFLWSIGTPNFYINALIPTIGYILSTLSLPWMKKMWIQYHNKNT